MFERRRTERSVLRGGRDTDPVEPFHPDDLAACTAKEPALRVDDLRNQSLADCIHLQIQNQQARWNMNAYGTPELLAKFGEISQAMALHAQDLSERIVELGGISRGTLTWVCERSGLNAYPESRCRKNTDVEAIIMALTIIRDSVLDDADRLACLDDGRSAGILHVIARTTGHYLADLLLTHMNIGEPVAR